MDDLEIIRSVMDQHKVLADQIDKVNASMSDKDALLRLEKAQAELAVDFRQPLNVRQRSLIEMLKTMAQGLKKHYDFEEEKLPPLLGTLLMEALIIEHRDLLSEMQKAISTIDRINLKGMSHIDEDSQEAIMNQSLSNLRNKKLDHQKREEATLLTLQYILEEKAKQPKLKISK
jgi:hypothetical protein